MLEIEYVNIGDIKPYAGNAKKHPAEQIEQIKESIEEFGFNDPIAVWHDEIVEGHGRLIAATELGIDTVPIIRLDELTDAQRRAYTLVHNKLTMNSGFDADMLSAELGTLDDVDMSQFGFDADDLFNDTSSYYGDERERTNNAYNLDKNIGLTLTNDFWQMPVINCDDYIPADLIGFNYAKTSEEKNVGIHFFVDDYQFERVWNNPEKYVDILGQYECILSPDFSLYMDMPMPMKIWNVYRSRQIGAYYQKKGIRVIPTISWAEEETFSFAFCGIPSGSIVAVSTVGVRARKDALEMFANGVDAMIEAISPRAIMLYGGDVDYDFGDIEVKRYENRVTEKWKNGRQRVEK